MKNYFLAFFLVTLQMAFSQNKQLWAGYFSYNEVNDLTESTSKITASTQKALFSKNFSTNELKTTTTIDGLSGQDITSIYYSASYNKTFVGHANGLMLVINESDGRILVVPGIRDQAGVTPNRKRINHFFEFEGKLYISCDFGVVQYNLITSGFGDTYLIGPAGGEVIAYQTVILGDFIYVNTKDNRIRRANIANANLNDYNQWDNFDAGSWIGIAVHNNQLVGLNVNNNLYKFTGNVATVFASVPQDGVEIRSYANKLVVTSLNHVYVFDENLVQTHHVISTQIPDLVATFNCATVINNILYIGTKENGIITASLSNISSFQTVKPDGPSRNNVFGIQTAPQNKLWVAYGGYDIYYVPDESSYGISQLSNKGWLNLPYSEMLGAKSLVRFAVNPKDRNNVFVASYFSGILEIDDDEVIAKYDQNTPDGPETLFISESPNYRSVRINGMAFDRDGNLWFNNGFVNNAVKVFKTDGTWQSYPIVDYIDGLSNSYGRMTIDKNSTKWFTSTRNGVIGFNESVTPKFKLVDFGEDEQNPLMKNATAVAVDNRNQLWIGTMAGLRILPGVDRFLGDDDLNVNPIIILDDGLPQELLYEQFITDIVVDGANNKWVGTADSGVFLLSPNGQETLYRFTRENSPLPSNTINDIDINGETGEVFFATTAGLVSFKGTSTTSSGDLSQVYVYPNPVRPEFFGTVKISGLINKANVKITDIEGNLVYEATSEGGTLEWDTKAFGKHRVASGVYMIFIASEDGAETKVKKVMIIR